MHGSSWPRVSPIDPVESRDFISLEGEMAGPYRIEALIGQGATSSVYFAIHPHIGAQVAIKVLHPDVAQVPGVGDRFVREARASNMVDSPHVLPIRDFGKLRDGRDYAVMDLLRGQPLDSLLEAEGAIDEPRALLLLRQMAAGLAAAHRAGVLHRDVKPGNLFVTRGPAGEHVFILDFGIAKLLEATVLAETQTAEGVLVGTPGYCAPEQALHQGIGPAADVYALGTVAYEMLSRKPLFTAPSVVELLADKVRARSVSLDGLPSGVSPELVSLLGRMLAREPGARPSMHEVESFLLAIPGRESLHDGVMTAGTRPSCPSITTQLGLPRSAFPSAPVILAPASIPPVETDQPPRRRTSRVLVAAVLAGVLIGAAVAVIRASIGPSIDGTHERQSAAAVTSSVVVVDSESSAGPPPAAPSTSVAPKLPDVRTPLPRPKNPRPSSVRDPRPVETRTPPPPGLIDPFAE